MVGKIEDCASPGSSWPVTCSFLVAVAAASPSRPRSSTDMPPLCPPPVCETSDESPERFSSFARGTGLRRDRAAVSLVSATARNEAPSSAMSERSTTPS